MQIVLQGIVFLLMVSVGMSLRPMEVASTVRRVEPWYWLGLLAATFLVPPALALLIANVFRLTPGETLGLFMVGVAPGAPLLTRNLARRGFEMHMAATYQVWAALLIPVMLPLVVAAGASLYGKIVWISPLELLKQIAEKQFLPLSVGVGIAWAAPKISQRLQPRLTILGNLLFTGLVVGVLIKLGPALRAVTPLTPVAAALLAVGSVVAILLLPFRNVNIKETFAICNANRHVGLALLLTGEYGRGQSALPAILCYALVAPVLLLIWAKRHHAMEAPLARSVDQGA